MLGPKTWRRPLKPAAGRKRGSPSGGGSYKTPRRDYAGDENDPPGAPMKMPVAAQRKHNADVKAIRPRKILQSVDAAGPSSATL